MQIQCSLVTDREEWDWYCKWELGRTIRAIHLLHITYHRLFLLLSFYRTRVRSLVMLVTHWLTHSLTHWLTDSCLVNLIDVTLACEDAFSKLIEVVTVADVDSEDHVGNSLLQIWELKFGPKTKLFSDFEHKGWSRFWSWSSARFWNWSLFSILPLMFCRGYEVESWSIFWS